MNTNNCKVDSHLYHMYLFIFVLSLASSSSSRYQAIMESCFGVVKPRPLGIVIKHIHQAIKAGNCERANHWLLTFPLID